MESKMGKQSTKKNKNVYQTTREERGYTRERAAEVLEALSPERIERIESGKSDPHPDEVLIMAEKYKKPMLCNYYCSNECPIGRLYVPEVKAKELSQTVLEILASLNALYEKKSELVAITVDGKIDDSEREEFRRIQADLESISVAVETLQLWVESAIATGKMDDGE